MKANDTMLTAAPSVRPAYCSIERWVALSGVGRRKTYDLLGLGLLSAVKSGSSTLIDVERGLAYLRSLPPAKIKPPHRQHRPDDGVAA